MKTSNPEEKAMRRVRQLIWLYFLLLLIEGALRKWIVPRLSNPLLVIRDPVLVLLYYFAIRARVFPRNVWIAILVGIGIPCLATTVIQLLPYLSPVTIAFVSGYGFRCNFFHIPLIFIMAAALRPSDVRTFGWWILVLLIPMTLLMVVQFRSSPDALVNRTAGGETEMMLSALGRVRTAGPFSFVIGVVAYFALASAFLIWGFLKKGVYKNWLLIPAGCALVIGVAVSGSRSVVGACVVVVASLIVPMVLRPDMMSRFAQAIILTVILGFLVSRTTIFREGVTVLSARFTEVAEATDQSLARGFVSRLASSFEEGIFIYGKAPWLGYGLGVGTNAGAKFLTGRSMFLLTEGEWSRIFLESGRILGLAYVLWRLAFVVRMGWMSVRSVVLGNVLPLLLFAGCCLPFISGQFGQPTILGFAVFTAGLVLAATKEEAPASTLPPANLRAVPRPKVMRSRSVYADRLHGPPAAQDQTNGSADR